METPYRATADTWVLPSFEAAPGLGVLPVNAFLIHAAQPVLVDAGMVREAPSFIDRLSSIIDPGDLRWIFLTHEEADHFGALPRLLAEAPNAQIAMNWVAMSKLKATGFTVPMDRLHLINPGQSIDAGDRTLTALQPPLFDSPSSLGMFDDNSRSLFSADAFGAIIPEHAEDVTDVPAASFREGFSIFNRANHPWVHQVDRAKFDMSLAALKNMDIANVLSAHAPAAHGRINWLLCRMGALPDMDPYVGPDQAAVMEMLARLLVVP